LYRQEKKKKKKKKKKKGIIIIIIIRRRKPQMSDKLVGRTKFCKKIRMLVYSLLS